MQTSFDHIYINGLRTRTWQELDAAIAGLGARRKAAAARIIVKVTEEFARQIIQSSNYQKTASRVPNQELLLLHFDTKARLIRGYSVQSSGQYKELATDDITHLRSCELASHFDGAGELAHHSHEAYAFSMPSGRVSERFTRVANVLINKDSVDAFAFWVLPLCSECSVIMLDSWTIAPIAFRAQYLLMQHLVYSGSSNYLRPFEVTSFVKHPVLDQSAAAEVLAEAIEISDGERPHGCLVSIGSSGAFAESVMEAAEATSAPLSSEHIHYLCSTHDAIESVKSKSYFTMSENVNLDHGATTRTIVGIDPILLYPRPEPERPVKLTAKQFGVILRKTNKEPLKWTNLELLIAKAGELDAIRFHYTYSEKHYPFFIDAVKLVKSGLFDSKIAELKGKKWDFIAHSNKPKSKELANYLSQRLAIKVVCLNDVIPNQFSSKKVLIVEDGINTGDQIVKLSVLVRQTLTSSSIAPKAIDYLAAIVSCADDKFSAVKIALSRGNEWTSAVHHLMKIELPQQSSCPWCVERRLLSKWEGKFRFSIAPTWLTQRTTLLDDPEGLSCPLFSIQDEVEHCGAGSPVFSEGWNAAQITLLFAIGVERLRREHNLRDRLMSDYFNLNVLSASALDNFNEDLLRATLLRVLPPLEWGILGQNDLVRRLKNYCSNPEVSTTLYGEILIFWASRNVLPRWSKELLTAISQGHHGDNAIVKLVGTE